MTEFLGLFELEIVLFRLQMLLSTSVKVVFWSLKPIVLVFSAHGCQINMYFRPKSVIKIVIHIIYNGIFDSV